MNRPGEKCFRPRVPQRELAGRLERNFFCSVFKNFLLQLCKNRKPRADRLQRRNGKTFALELACDKHQTGSNLENRTAYRKALQVGVKPSAANSCLLGENIE